MIIDNIKNISWYGFSDVVNSVCTFLTEALEKEVGTYELPSGMYALVQEYTTITQSEGKLENHKKYVDLQYIASGEEKIGVTLNGVISQPYDEQSDVAFFTGSSSLVTLKEGEFALFFPQDIHMPKIGSGSFVKKVVIKIPVELFNN